MASHNEFPGYVALPGKRSKRETVRLDFNSRLESDPKQTRLEGFALRLFTQPRRFGDKEPEIGVYLTTEQWLDLMTAMRKEFRQAQKLRKKMERSDGDGRET